MYHLNMMTRSITIFFFERRGELGQAHDIKDKEGCDIGLEAHW